MRRKLAERFEVVGDLADPELLRISREIDRLVAGPKSRASQNQPAILQSLPPAEFGRALRQARRRAGLTQGLLAGEEFSVAHVSAAERGHILPSPRAFAALLHSLSPVEADELRRLYFWACTTPRSLGELADWHWRARGDLPAAIRCAARRIALARRANRADEVARGAVQLGQLLFAGGQPERAWRTCLAVERRLLGRQHWDAVAEAALIAGRVALELWRDYPTALGCLLRAQEWAVRADAAGGTVACQAVVASGMALAAMGLHEEAAQAFTRAESLAAFGAEAEWRIRQGVGLAGCLQRLGRTEEAAALLEGLLPLLGEHGAPAQHAQALADLGSCHVCLGQWTEAERWFAAAEDEDGRGSGRAAAARAAMRIDQALTALHRGRPARAAEWLAAARTLLEGAEAVDGALSPGAVPEGGSGGPWRSLEPWLPPRSLWAHWRLVHSQLLCVRGRESEGLAEREAALSELAALADRTVERLLRQVQVAARRGTG